MGPETIKIELISARQHQPLTPDPHHPGSPPR